MYGIICLHANLLIPLTCKQIIPDLNTHAPSKHVEYIVTIKILV